MLEHVPAWLGRALAGRRAGTDKLAVAQPGMAPDHSGEGAMTLSSPAFADGARLPERFTADGAGVSPPLLWSGVPAGATLALLVEDADAPTANPLVHAVLWGLDVPAGGLEEGAITLAGEAGEVGRNSFFRQGWLPPDPPTGHGEHRYVFQLFAVTADAPDPREAPNRAALVEVMAGHVLAAAVLTGTYSRGEEALVGPVGSTVRA